jgi:transcriptional regulator with XRE-family HTH domain
MQHKSFAKLFEEARKRDPYWIAKAIYIFTEDLHKLAENENISRAELARRLGVSPAYITKLFRGNANFTIGTMVRLARAVKARLHLHLTPDGKEVHWINWDSSPVERHMPTVNSKADQYESVSMEGEMEEDYDLAASVA